MRRKSGNHENACFWLLPQQISPKLGPIEAKCMSRPFKADDSQPNHSKNQEKTRLWTNLSLPKTGNFSLPKQGCFEIPKPSHFSIWLFWGEALVTVLHLLSVFKNQAVFEIPKPSHFSIWFFWREGRGVRVRTVRPAKKTHYFIQ